MISGRKLRSVPSPHVYPSSWSSPRAEVVDMKLDLRAALKILRAESTEAQEQPIDRSLMNNYSLDAAHP